ncbi:preprotein translocase subunit YidC [Clostridium sp. SY8519]|uniref:YidC/Oxa1 family membrane protein insertase n=1 Tax=Clostridium sp. (strain SY8519) TaxID=1042156 RepID=UPI0002171A39|nr:YidC/Oxa1 family membrane protein insertase [Clostridium sp. SY8519]BAK46931.1 preprotein translocase subunit YidC [Clostridium sp. SY8519]
MGLLLTQSSGVLRPIAVALGWLMNLIYIGLSKIGINNVALTIIVFTILIYLCMMPLTYQQQKFSKMTMIMNPELQAIQKKYRGKRDQASVNAMNEETQAVYRKYGVSPSGSCIYLVIQLPILFALYRVIYNVPAYISSVKNTFTDLAAQVYATSGAHGTMTKFLDSIQTYAMRGVKLDWSSATAAKDSIIDVLYKCTSSNWDLFRDTFPNISSGLISTTQAKAEAFNSFLGVSVVYSPKNIIATSFHEGHYLLILIAILIPVISAATQFINIRLMPTSAGAGAGGMGGQMKAMNYMMPIYSFILVFFLPVGVGVYWIAGALIRSFQQWFFNRRLDRMDMDEMIKKNRAKAEEKEKKRLEKKSGVSGQTISKSANISTKKIDTSSANIKKNSMAAKANAVKHSNKNNKTDSPETETQQDAPVTYKKGSLTSKANLVKDFNNRNTKK